MATPLRNFDPPNFFTDDEGRLTEEAQGFLRSLFSYIGASAGSIPVGTLGGDGSSTTTFLREDGSWEVPNYPVGANPSVSAGLTAVNGSAATFLRSDAAPAISQSITPTWTGAHTFNSGLVSTTLRATGAFGCNGATAQTSYSVDAAIGGTAGAAYTATEQALINSLISQINKLRAALVANGIAV